MTSFKVSQRPARRVGQSLILTACLGLSGCEYWLGGFFDARGGSFVQDSTITVQGQPYAVYKKTPGIAPSNIRGYNAGVYGQSNKIEYYVLINGKYVLCATNCRQTVEAFLAANAAAKAQTFNTPPGQFTPRKTPVPGYGAEGGGGSPGY